MKPCLYFVFYRTLVKLASLNIIPIVLSLSSISYMDVDLSIVVVVRVASAIGIIDVVVARVVFIDVSFKILHSSIE